MNEERLDNMLKSYFSDKHEPDERIKRQIEQKAYERIERRSNILLCFIQAAMVFFTVAVSIAFFIFAQGFLLPALIAGGIFAGNMISIIVVILKSKNNNKARGLK